MARAEQGRSREAEESLRGGAELFIGGGPITLSPNQAREGEALRRSCEGETRKREGRGSKSEGGGSSEANRRGGGEGHLLKGMSLAPQRRRRLNEHLQEGPEAASVLRGGGWSPWRCAGDHRSGSQGEGKGCGSPRRGSRRLPCCAASSALRCGGGGRRGDQVEKGLRKGGRGKDDETGGLAAGQAGEGVELQERKEGRVCLVGYPLDERRDNGDGACCGGGPRGTSRGVRGLQRFGVAGGAGRETGRGRGRRDRMGVREYVQGAKAFE